MLSREQVLYLRLEAEGVRLLPIAARRTIAKEIYRAADISVPDAAARRLMVPSSTR